MRCRRAAAAGGAPRWSSRSRTGCRRRCSPRRTRRAGEVAFWRCANERAQAQAVAAEVERLIARGEASRPRTIVRARALRARRGPGGRASPSRSARSPTACRARRRSSSAPRCATCSPGCACSPTPATPARSCARSRARRSSCARSTSRASPRSPAGASSTWSPRCRPRSSRRRSRPRRASASPTSCACTARRPRRSTRRGPDLYVHRLVERLGLRRQLLFAAPGRGRRAAGQPRQVRRARGRLRAPHAAGHRARVRALDRRGRRRRPARGGGDRRRAPARRAGDDDARGQGARVRPRLRARADGRAHAGRARGARSSRSPTR